MSIIRGTLRLSIVIALAVVIFGAGAAHMKAGAAQDESYRLWSTLRCGKPFLGTDMSRYTNELGLIDIGRAGCAREPFLARFDEIEAALNQSAPEPRYAEVFKREFIAWTFFGVLSLVLVNIGGILFIGGRRLVRWIIEGYSRKSA